MSEDRKGFNLSAWAVGHPAVILFLIIATTIAGGIAYLNLGRAEDPTFTIKTMVVQVVWPGAKADEMQRLVAEPLEKRLQELPQLDYVRTFSRPNVTVLSVQLRDSLRGRDVADTWYQVRKKLTDSRSELPQGVIGPTFDDEYGDVYSAVYMLTGDGASRADLKRYGEAMRLALLRVPSVAKVALIGDIPQRIFVEISHRKLATIGISPQVIFDAIARQNAVVASGSVDTTADRVEVRVTGAFDGVAAIRAVPIEAGGRVFQLGDIAEVARGYEDPPTYIVEHEGKSALGVAVAITEKANVLEFGRNLEAAVAAFRETLPTGIVIDQVSNQPKVVAKAVDQFLHSFVEALLIVLAVSFISLGWRTGIVVALSVPLVLAIVSVIMQMMGLNLDRITLGALIIALGLLVDDAIIAIEMMVVKMEAGFDRIRSATAAWESTAFPMLTGTLVTAAGFLPVGFAQSTAGEYAGNIFWVVAIALVVSWVVAVLFTPYLGMRLLPELKQHAASHDALYDTRLYRVLRRGVTWSLAHRWRVIALTLAALAASGVGMTFVQQQFFPTTSRPELFIETRMPEGTAIAVTRQAAEKAATLLKGDDDVVTYTTYVGAGAPRFFFSLNPVLPNPAFALTVIMTKGPEARERLKAKLERAIADGAVPQARVRIDRLTFGPPVGFPVQFRVIGPDPLRVREIADQVRTIMRQNPDTIAVQFDWNEQVKRIELALNQDRLRAFGLSTADVGLTLQTLLSGTPISEYREGINLIKVVARAPASERLDIGALSDLTIQTNGGPVPLAQIATISYGFEEPILWRRNRDMVLTVRSDIVPGIQAPMVTKAILPKLQQLKEALPAGYRIDTGGAIEESEKANTALFKLFPLMFLVMLSLLMFQLQSFSKLFLVFSTAPLGIIGAVAALLAFNAPFGFVALLGVIALAGMIMRNTVILVDQIDHDLAEGRSPWDAIIESTVRRARPVVLTALAAMLAMIPLTRSDFWGPMAMAMMGGLVVATVLTLLFLPALYAAWFRVQQPAVEAEVSASMSSHDVEHPVLRAAE
jgi:multidrug efflux pump subunit AcrB